MVASEFKSISAKISREEFTLIDEYCRKKDITPSSLIRELLLKEIKISVPHHVAGANKIIYKKDKDNFSWIIELDDGTESDMDLGTYERFLDKNITKDNYLTGGKIFTKILSMERKGEYLGRDVQFIPHVTGEIKLFLRELAVKTNADIVLIEVGGTVGDIENQYFIEAMRDRKSVV